MQTDKSQATDSQGTDEDEFSGLHDLKELANSARARSRRATSQGDTEIATLASTSASFKAVALTTAKTDPGIAVVVTNTAALSPKGDTPAKSPLRAQGTRVDQLIVAGNGVAGNSAEAAVATTPVVVTADAAAKASYASAPAVTPTFESSFGAGVASAKPADKKRTWLALGGLIAAVAVAGGLFLALGNTKSDTVATPSAPVVAPSAAPAQPLPAAAPAVEQAAAPAVEEPAVVAVPEQFIAVEDTLAGKDAKDAKQVKAAAIDQAPAVAAPAVIPAPVKDVKSTGDKSIDDLLSDASSSTGIVDREAEIEKKKAERTELSRSDIKKSFGAVQPAVSGCYKKFKEVGTVSVRVTVLPSGQVTKVVAGGAFAGTPTGDCVVAATQGANFPEWDGSQTTLSYSFLLGE